MGDEIDRGSPSSPDEDERSVSPDDTPVKDDGTEPNPPITSSFDPRVLPTFGHPDVDWLDGDTPLAAPLDHSEEGEGVVAAPTMPRFETPETYAAARTADRLDGVVPIFERPERPPTQRSRRTTFPSRVLPRFERVPSGSGAGALLGDAVRGTVRSEPAATTVVEESTREEIGGFALGGPEYDEEMPLTEHIEEMLKRLAVVIVVAGAISLVAFPFADRIITFLWFSILPAGELARPRLYGPLELLMTRIKVASLVGLIIALPVLVYETYAFMRPGLYPHERRYYLAAVPTSLVLAVVGVLFAYFIVLPAIFTYFLFYSEDAGTIAFALGQTFDLILILMAYLAIVFQIPLFIMLAIMMGLVTRRWLAEKRLYFWGAFLGLSFISSPDPTGMTPIIIALTMVGLFEGTLALLKWVDRGKQGRRKPT